MALTILGLSGALSHDPSAALYIDGKLIAAAEEERFVRDKHAKNRMPYESAKFCLEQAGITPSPRGFIPVDDRMATSVPGLWAIGDVNGRCLLAHAASAQAVYF